MTGVKLADFARRFGISDRHARRLLNDHESELCGHFERNTKGTWIDDFAADFLRDLLRNPVEILPVTQENDVPSVDDYEALQAKYMQLLEESRELEREYRQYVTNTTEMLQTAASQISLAERAGTLEGENARLSADVAQKDKAIEELKDAAQKADAEYKAALEAERNRPITFKEWWRRRRHR